jgi:amino acid transporter
MSKEKGLAGGSLGTLESAVMGAAGSAPAFSVAVTTAVIVASVGVLSVGSVLYCGLIMFGILFAFMNLNKMTSHAGATYAWVGAVFGSRWGFFAGWDQGRYACTLEQRGLLVDGELILLNQRSVNKLQS